jgi:hypothetical protein
LSDADCFLLEFTCEVMVEIRCVQFDLDIIFFMNIKWSLALMTEFYGIHLLFLPTSPFCVGFYVVYTSVSIWFCVWIFLSYDTTYGVYSCTRYSQCFLVLSVSFQIVLVLCWFLCCV